MRVKALQDSVVIDLGAEAVAVSTTVLGGGLRKCRYVVFHRVKGDLGEPARYATEVASSLSLDPFSTVMFLTSVDVVRDLVIARGEVGTTSVTVFSTVGLTNTVDVARPNRDVETGGTINLFVYVDGDVTAPALIEMVKTATEAKVEALVELDVRTPSGGRGYATSTDAIAVAAARVTEGVGYAGPLTPLGGLVARLVYEAVTEGAARSGYAKGRPAAARLRERGIALDSVAEAVLELLSSEGGGAIPGRGIDAVRSELEDALRDPVVTALVDAFLRLEDDISAGLVPEAGGQGCAEEARRPVVGKVLGMALAMYINGWLGLLEYLRLSEGGRPEGLPRLPSLIGDCVAALAGGVASRLRGRAAKG